MANNQMKRLTPKFYYVAMGKIQSLRSGVLAVKMNTHTHEDLIG